MMVLDAKEWDEKNNFKNVLILVLLDDGLGLKKIYYYCNGKE